MSKIIQTDTIKKEKEATLALVKSRIEKQLASTLAMDAAAIMEKAVEMAKDGDRVMIKFLLERFMSAASHEKQDTAKLSGGIQIIVNPLSQNKPVEINTTVIEGEAVEDTSKESV